MSRRQTKIEQARRRRAAFLAGRARDQEAQSRMIVDRLIDRGWDIYADKTRGTRPRAAHMARVFILACLALVLLGMLADLAGCP